MDQTCETHNLSRELMMKISGLLVGALCLMQSAAFAYSSAESRAQTNEVLRRSSQGIITAMVIDQNNGCSIDIAQIRPILPDSVKQEAGQDAEVKQAPGTVCPESMIHGLGAMIRDLPLVSAKVASQGAVSLAGTCATHEQAGTQTTDITCMPVISDGHSGQGPFVIFTIVKDVPK